MAHGPGSTGEYPARASRGVSGRGDLVEAERIFRRALEIGRVAPEPDNQRTAMSRRVVPPGTSFVLQARGAWAAAEPLEREAYEIGSAPSSSSIRRSSLGSLDDDNMVQYLVIMIRTQISLSEKEYQAAKQEARRLGISFAEFLRRSLRTALPLDESKPWMHYAGMVESGDPRSSQRIDETVYGQKG